MWPKRRPKPRQTGLYVQLAQRLITTIVPWVPALWLFEKQNDRIERLITQANDAQYDKIDSETQINELTKRYTQMSRFIKTNAEKTQQMQRAMAKHLRDLTIAYQHLYNHTNAFFHSPMAHRPAFTTKRAIRAASNLRPEAQ